MINKNGFAVILGTLYKVENGELTWASNGMKLSHVYRFEAKYIEDQCDSYYGAMSITCKIVDMSCDTCHEECQCGYIEQYNLENMKDGDIKTSEEYELRDPQVGLELVKELIDAGFTTKEIATIERVSMPCDIGEGAKVWKLSRS